MDSGVKLTPTYHYYKDGSKIGEYVGSSYPALEVRSCSTLSIPSHPAAPTQPSQAIALLDVGANATPPRFYRGASPRTRTSPARPHLPELVLISCCISCLAPLQLPFALPPNCMRFPGFETNERFFDFWQRPEPSV